MSEMISVIVPVYNVEKYLERCVESIVVQTYSELEIILVDDGSTDNCSRICDDWAGKDPRIKVIHKENGGLSDARNAGIKTATGQYIGFVDSDDYIEPHMYERLYVSICESGSDISVCGVELVYPNKRVPFAKNIDQVVSDEKAQEMLMDEDILKQPVWCRLYSRRVIQGIWFEKGRYHEDVFWSYRVIGKAKKVSMISYVGYYYRQRDNSIMGNDYSLKRLDAVAAVCQRHRYFEKHYPALVNRSIIKINEVCLYNGQMALLHLNREERKKSFRYLEAVLKKYPIRLSKNNIMKPAHKMWVLSSKISLSLTCRVRNILKVGF